ncbi:MAG: pyruvate dehydrogenase (acetyl-transferring) E1 component subunit alpha [Dehalococcoidia bacterium]|nr:pyruvate dehydrogenase (acetyl-transferring) E1 component subunit alpha [Dehalococcoidia bacterium]
MKVAINIDKAQVADFYRKMLLIRRFEEASGRLYMQGLIRGFLHLYIGEEAVAVGAIGLLEPQDYIITHYRDHGHALARGMDPKACMAELCGRATGSSGGKGGSMHLFDANLHFMGGHAIVGGQMPIGVGMGLGIKMKQQNGVVMVFFGDGAVNEGEFHESLNLASLWKLPVVFMLENNLYGMGSHVDMTHAAGRDIYNSAEYYKIPATQVDGMDLIAVREATSYAIDRVRSGSGPVFLEAMTYRYRGHSMADPVNYREMDEVEEWRINDPIDRFKALALGEGLITTGELEEIDSQVADEIDEAVKFARESPFPELDELYDNVYA